MQHATFGIDIARRLLAAVRLPSGPDAHGSGSTLPVGRALASYIDLSDTVLVRAAGEYSSATAGQRPLLRLCSIVTTLRRQHPQPYVGDALLAHAPTCRRHATFSRAQSHH